MSTSFFGFGALLFTLPVLIGQWVGILGLGKADRNSAWWCMFAGICSTTLGMIGSTLFIALMMTGYSPFSGGMSSGTVSVVASSGLSGLGSLLFAIGFAIHGHQTSNVRLRTKEIEAIAAAQGEELSRLRDAQGGVS